jgi:NitT/TauT family transport system substrate-binding protein
MTTPTRIACGSLVIFLCAAAASSAGDAPVERLSMAVPGVPPVFAGVVAFVAREEGFFKKYGVEVEVRPFDSGAAAAQAVVAGGIDFSLSPTPVIVRMVSNGNVDLVGLYGMEHPDWLLGSADPAKKKCENLKGEAVGVDSVGGARAVALGEFLRPCGLKISEVKLVSLSSNVGAAMIGGQIKFGVLHSDDVPVLEEQMGRPIAVIESFKEVNPLSHYILIVVTRERLKQKRDGYVRALAGIIDAGKFMIDPRNADRVAQIATATGRTAKLAKEILPRLYQIEFWPVGKDGLAQTNLENVVKVEEQLGGIKPGKTPVTYQRLVDRTVWKDANALVK